MNESTLKLYSTLQPKIQVKTNHALDYFIVFLQAIPHFPLRRLSWLLQRVPRHSHRGDQDTTDAGPGPI